MLHGGDKWTWDGGSGASTSDSAFHAQLHAALMSDTDTTTTACMAVGGPSSTDTAALVSWFKSQGLAEEDAAATAAVSLRPCALQLPHVCSYQLHKCPPGAVFHDRRCHVHMESHPDTAWTKAETSCRTGLNVSAAHLTSSPDSAFLRDIGPPGPQWIGLNDRARPDVWAFTDGASTASAPRPVVQVGAAAHSCVLQDADGVWRAAACSESNGYVCSYDMPSTSLCTGGGGLCFVKSRSVSTLLANFVRKLARNLAPPPPPPPPICCYDHGLPV